MTKDAFENRVLKFAIAALLIGVQAFLMGSALVSPPKDQRQFRFTLAGTPLTTADVDLNILQFNKGPSCGLVLKNDNAAGGGDLLFCVTNGVATAAAGADGATGSTTSAVAPGEAVPIDGTYTHVAVRSSSGNTAARIIVLFDK